MLRVSNPREVETEAPSPYDDSPPLSEDERAVEPEWLRGPASVDQTDEVFAATEPLWLHRLGLCLLQEMRVHRLNDPLNTSLRIETSLRARSDPGFEKGNSSPPSRASSLGGLFKPTHSPFG
jgi:hypothetical protein